MEIDLRRYLMVIKRWWWLLIIGAIIPAVISYYFTSKQPALYQAKVTLMVGTTLQSSNPDTSLMRTSATLAEAYAELVRYRPITEAVIQRLGLERSHEELASQIVAWVRPNANLLEIRVTDTNPKAAMLIANALAEELIRQSPGSGQGQRQQQQEFIKQQLDELEEKIEKKKAEIAELNDSLSDLTSAAEIADTMARIDALENVVSTYRTQYAALLQSYAGDSVNVLSIVEPAVEPWEPIGGKTKLILAVAAGAGLALALGAAFLIEYLDDTVHWEGGRRQTLAELPILGAMPRMSRRRRTWVAATRYRYAEIEAIRNLRTNIFLSTPGKPLDTILVTSPEVGDGKSFTVANLGLTIAVTGMRVVLVDADMRKPTLHEMFDVPNVAGLAELLGGASTIPEAWPPVELQPTGVSNLFLLSSGRPPADPAALLVSPRLSAVLETLKKYADVVIIDSPPALIAPDAAILASVVDGTVLVVSEGQTNNKAVSKAQALLTSRNGVNLLGTAFNRVKLDGTYAYYGRYHDDGYGSLSRLRNLVTRWRSPKPAEKQVVSLGEAAERLGISPGMARRWCKEGRLPAYRSRLRWWVKREDLENLVTSLRGGGAEIIEET
ncbi:MAG: polysaccharide biosynthesis tyrosine autokinase [Anaerolineae bacterium]|jgi:non-specific protein-tyrosine kinase|nr:polysaccharide biosynthesis tyrosine autokinase [Anaerolineae bacterium]MDH7473316.1 polysaccharide biosynthesis tyrosine autokinase [Anaerolineae bacterium]